MSIYKNNFVYFTDILRFVMKDVITADNNTNTIITPLITATVFIFDDDAFVCDTVCEESAFFDGISATVSESVSEMYTSIFECSF